MSGGFMNFFRGRKLWRVLLALVSLFFVLSSLRAQAATECQEGEACEQSQALDRGFVSQIVGEPRGRPLEGEELLAKTHELGFLLRCPTCQGSSVSDSPSSTALNMRQEVHDLLAAGYDQEQVLAYFEAAYGQFVLLEPKAEGIAVLVWLSPAIFLLIGAGLVISYFRKQSVAVPAGEAPQVEQLEGRDRLPDDDELASWVLKVREIAYGWPGGKPPEGSAS